MKAECGPQGVACAKGLLFHVTGLGRIRLMDCLVDIKVISEHVKPQWKFRRDIVRFGLRSGGGGILSHAG
jgi:hypothetical protein